VRISQWPRTKDKEVAGAQRESEEPELASGCHPAKNDIFCDGQVFSLDRVPFNGCPLLLPRPHIPFLLTFLNFSFFMEK